MRMTLDLPEDLLAAATQLAAARRLSVEQVFEASLRAYLALERHRARESLPVLPLPIVRGVRTVHGVDLDDTSALLCIE